MMNFDPEKAERQHRLLLEKWLHEDELLNHRLTWLMVSQTLLFTVYAALYYADATARLTITQFQNGGQNQNALSAGKLIDQLEHLVPLVPVIGASVSFLIWIAVVGAIGAMHVLQSQHTKAITIPPYNVHEHYGYHRLGIADITTWAGLAAPLCIPLIFTIVWIEVWLGYSSI
jgi:hypothetical protein